MVLPHKSEALNKFGFWIMKAFFYPGQVEEAQRIGQTSQFHVVFWVNDVVSVPDETGEVVPTYFCFPGFRSGGGDYGCRHHPPAVLTFLGLNELHLWSQVGEVVQQDKLVI